MLCAFDRAVPARQRRLQRTLIDSVSRLGWVRHLPSSRRLGRDLQRARAAYDVLERR